MSVRARQQLHAWDIGASIVIEGREADPTDPAGRRTRPVDLSAINVARVIFSITPPKVLGTSKRYEREGAVKNPPGTDALLEWITTSAQDLPHGGDYSIEVRIHTTEGNVHRTLPVTVAVESGSESGPPRYVEPAAIPLEVEIPDPVVVIA